jgi:hypothetical protein
VKTIVILWQAKHADLVIVNAILSVATGYSEATASDNRFGMEHPTIESRHHRYQE